MIAVECKSKISSSRVRQQKQEKTNDSKPVKDCLILLLLFNIVSLKIQRF